MNLSAGGIGFYAPLPIPAGRALEMELVLLPSMFGILAYGKVVHITHVPRAPPHLQYCMAVEFCKIREKDRSLITRHVLNK